jgi:hypothetical protein
VLHMRYHVLYNLSVLCLAIFCAESIKCFKKHCSCHFQGECMLKGRITVIRCHNASGVG